MKSSETMEEQTTKRIIKFIAKNKLVKYTQLIELSSFMVCGYLLTMDVYSVLVMFFIGIFFALLAGESALLEHDLKKGAKHGC